MPTTVKYEPVQTDITVYLQEGLSPEGQSKAFAQFAREARDEAISDNRNATGADLPYDTFVDGVAGASEDNVRPDGEIIYEFQLLTEAFAWIDEQLRIHSPVLTGTYQKSHVFFADGIEADPL